MAFDGNIKSNCLKTDQQNVLSNPVSSTLNGVCESGNDSSTNILLTPLIHKNKHTRILIKTDTPHAQKIGLNVNTNVHLKPKKRYDCVHFINELLIILLTIYGILSYFEIQRLKEDVHVIKLQLTVMDDSAKLNLEIVKKLINVIEAHMQEDVNLSKESGIGEHFITKRNAENVREVEGVCLNCTRSDRTARSVNRGPLALHLRGALPEITVRDGGIIAPWYIDKKSSGNFLLTEAVIGEMRGVLEIVEEGLYYIYAQIYYLTSASLNSYAIYIEQGGGRGQERVLLALCSTETMINKLAELSCFTSTVRYLRRGDRLFVIQRERNRRIIFRDNQSFLGLVLLNSHSPVLPVNNK